MSLRTPSLVAMVFALLLNACGGATDAPTDSIDQGALGHASTAKASIDKGDFPMLAGEPGQQLSPIGCRHYMVLGLSNSAADGATATFEAALDSADPSFMDGDSCGGEELPRSEHKKYVLHEVSTDPCGSRVLESTIPWTESGRVTRTLRIHDNRKVICGSPKPSARVVLDEFRTLDGEAGRIDTYYSVDPIR